MDDDNIDTSGIPDFAPTPQWAKGPPQLIKSLNQLEHYAVPVITKQTLINQLYIELMDRGSRNQSARILAAKLIADLNGWIDIDDNSIEENTDNLTAEEIKAVKDEFERSY